MYQDLVHRLRPDFILECGTHKGGSAYFLADLCSLNDKGRVISIDIEHCPDRPIHDRLLYLTGRSVDPEIISRIRAMIEPEDIVMVILDSDHSKENVLAELAAYSPLVTTGSYVIVEDTIMAGHPVLPDAPPGPMEAVKEFLSRSDSFVVDRSCERFFLTFNPSGYLQRVVPS